MSDALQFDELYRQYHPYIYRVCMGKLRNHANAQDAAADVFLKALTHLDSFRGECEPRTWLHRIAVNECINQMRRPSMISLDQPVGDDDDTTALQIGAPDRNLDVALVWVDLVKALGRLPERRKAALLLRADGAQYPEIGVLLGVSVALVRDELHRGRLRLRESLRAYRRTR